MAFFDKISDTIANVSKDVTQKAKDVSGIAKLKLDIKSKEDFIKEQYIQIGKAYYKAHKGEDVAEKDLFARIEEAKDAIADMELQILELKKARKCPKCGAEVAEAAEFCSGCGAKLGVVVNEPPYQEAAKAVDTPMASDEADACSENKDNQIQA